MAKLLSFSVALIVAVLILGACVTEPEPEAAPPVTDETEKIAGEVQNAQTTLLLEIEQDVVYGSPKRLEDGMEKIAESELAGTERGAELYYVASQLHSILYPFCRVEIENLFNPASSPYPEIFDAVRSGNLYDRVVVSNPLLFTIARSTVVLFTEEREILSQIRESLEQLDTEKEKSIIPELLLGFVYSKTGEQEQAIDSFTGVLRRTDSCYPANLELAKLYYATGEYKQVVTITGDLLEQFPGNVELLKLSAKTLYALGDLDASLNRTDELLVKTQEREVLILRLKIFLERGELESAKKIVKILDRLNGTTDEMLLLKATMLYKSGEAGQALEVIEQVIDREETNPETRKLYANILIKTGQSDRGIELLESLLQENREDRNVLLALIRHLVQLRRWEKGAQILSNYEISELSNEILELAYRIYEQRGDTDLERAMAEQLRANDPQNTHYILLLLQTVFNQQQIDRTFVGRLIEQGFQFAETREQRSQLYYYQSMIAPTDTGRIRLLQQALFENLKNIEALVAISKAYQRIEDYLKAYRYIKQAAILDPDNPEIMSELRMVEQNIR